MRILVACEESQVVCSAFRANGHEAYSCDILPTSGNHPEWHLQQDVIPLLSESWDLIIAHPPCTYLSNAGARWLYRGGSLNMDRYDKGLAARSFFFSFYDCSCPRVCIENPLPSRVFKLPSPTQVIQPYEYGHPYSKRTCLWLKGLPPLIPTEVLDSYVPFCSSGSYSRTHDPKYKGASRLGGSSRSRSRTFDGIAIAMASQWGALD